MKFVLIIAGIFFVVALAAGIWYFIAPPREGLINSDGKIEGQTVYPDGLVPNLLVCAQPIDSSKEAICINVPAQQEGQSELPRFSLSVQPGYYWVYAEPIDPSALGLDENARAYYTEYVRCGLTSDCKDHTKVEVDVISDQSITGIIPGDWTE